ncbi:hypothetical protein RJ639_017916 [Escallonia herrerae]|uniref:Uncharacterized protein ycf33 n=1 Tax=Escallonia herrerae TaxID=1293975 RepID=A0AA88V8M1_9ASTE|nr:hypothetical protein RJ639_017916 [Escallonia herrerae]
MKTLTLRPQFYFPRHTSLSNPPTNLPSLIPTRTTTSNLKHPTKIPSKGKTLSRQRANLTDKPLMLEVTPNSKSSSREDLFQVSPNGYSRFVVLGTLSVGFVLFLMGVDDHKALAFGPEGPLMEDFWDNMRRYGLYALTVSTGVLYAVFQPLVELLKNPISAILILTILGGGIFIVSQVVSAMVGVSEFSYDYGY